MTRNIIIAITLALLALFAVGSTFVKQQIETNELDKVEQTLQIVLDATQNRVRAWANARKRDVQYWVAQPLLHQYAESLLNGSNRREDLLATPTQAKLRELLQLTYINFDYRGYFIISPDYISLASSRDQNIGTKNLLTDQPEFLESVFSGNVAISLPMPSDVPLPDRDGRMEKSVMTMFVAAPIKNQTGDVIAAFTLRINPFDGFFDIFQQSHIGRTGEAYAFDKTGRMVGVSRFQDSLERAGFVTNETADNEQIMLRDPGGKNDAESDSLARPLTDMARQALAGIDGVNLGGYRDYRGVPVVGRWLWDSGLDLGLAVEIDVDEAYGPIKSSHELINVITLAAGVLLIGFAIFYWRNLTVTEQVKAARNELVKSHELMKLKAEVLNAYLHGKEMRGVFKSLLSGMLELTHSEYGFIGEVLHDDSGAPFLKTYAITDIAWDDESRRFYEEFKEKGFEFRKLSTLFGHTLTTGQAVISNDPEDDERSGGLPAAHPKMTSYLGLPFHLGDKMVGMIGLANRPVGYDDELVEFMQPLLNSCAYIFDRIASEKALIESETKFRRLVESTMDAVILFDEDRFIDGNPAALKLFGCESKEIFCQFHPGDLSPEKQPNGRDSKLFAEEYIKKTFQQGSLRFEWQHKSVDGREFPAEVSLSTVELGGKQMLQALVRDISDKKQAEKEKELMQKQLIQAQKMEALGHLTGGIAHDFNNILTAIIGYADLGGEAVNAHNLADLPEYLNEVRIAGIRAKELIGQMMAFSRGNNDGELKAIDLKPLISGVIKMLRPVLPSSIVINTRLDDVPLVMADPGQIQRVLMNLCINASDAMDGLGNIDFELGYVYDVEGVCTSCNAPVKGDFVELIVRDNGAGIEADKLNNVFEPFYTTKEVGKGTGMGLSVVHGIVHSHNGHVLIHAAPGEGAEFHLLFPGAVVAEQGAVAVHDGSSASSGCGDGQHVLVVDDEESITKLLEALLIKNGYKVTCFSDSVAALSCFSENADEFDLVITDQTMPGMTGVQMARIMLTLRPNLPVILCTGYSKQVDKASAEEMGISSFLPKPANVRELLLTVADLVRKPVAS